MVHHFEQSTIANKMLSFLVLKHIQKTAVTKRKAHTSPHRTDGTHRTHRIRILVPILDIHSYGTAHTWPHRISAMLARILKRAFNPMRADDADGLLQEMFLMDMIFYAMNKSII